MNLRLAVGQFAATPDKQRNRDAIAGLVRDASGRGARMVVLPENAMWSHPDKETDFFPISEPLDGDFVRFLSGLAHEHSVWLVCGMTERVEELGKVHNTLVVMDDEGRRITHYRKVHLFDSFGFRESATVEPGAIEDPPVFELGGLRIGILTCYDLRFPESSRRLADAGADVVVVPAAWVAGPMKEDHWFTLLKARAIENTVYVVAAGQTGPEYVGQSVVIDAVGVVLACAGPTPGLAVQEIDRTRVSEVREAAPVLAHRRFAVTPRASAE